MSADDRDDDIFDDEDEESDDEEDFDKNRDDTGSTGEDNQPQEKKMEDSQPKPVSAPKTPGRRAPLGMAGFRPVAQTPKAAEIVAAPTQAIAAVPMLDLAKHGIVMTETGFALYLAKSGKGMKFEDFNDVSPIKVGELVRKWANEVLETGGGTVDAWSSAIRKLIELADAKLANKQLSEEQATKFKVIAEYFNHELARLSPKPTTDDAATRKTAVATEQPKKAEPPALPTAKSQTTGTSAARATDPHAATETATPMPSRTSTPAGGRKSSITPEQEAMVAAAAQSIKDEPSVSIIAPSAAPKTEVPASPRFGFVPPDEHSSSGMRCPACGFALEPTKPCVRCGSALHVKKVEPPKVDTPPRTSVHPEADKAMKHELLERAADELPSKQVKAEKPKSRRGSLIFFIAIIALGFMTAFVVWRTGIIILSSYTAPTSSSAATAAPTVPQTVSETCTKVTADLLQRRYDQSDPSAFVFTKKAGVRIDCGGKILYQNPTSGAFDIRPCNICTR